MNGRAGRHRDHHKRRGLSMDEETIAELNDNKGEDDD